MPDAALSEALKEAYATAPVGQVVHHTLEFWHPAFTLPIRVVRDVTALDARLEAGAPRDGGEVVTFVGYAFDILPPDQTATGLPQCTIEIDNVSREILAQVDAAVVGTDKIEVIYRPFLSDALDEGPETDPPLAMAVQTISATPMRIRATAGFPDLLNARFPRLRYTSDRFPGLAR